MKHGVDPLDVWNLDTALAKWLGKRLKILGENTAWTPYGYDYDKWVMDLREYGKAFEDYGKDKFMVDLEEEKALHARVDKALEFLKDNFYSLWD